MNRDDRLFATIGGTVVTAAATVFLVFAGGITGTIEDQPTFRVAPNPVVETPVKPSDVVPASFEEPEPSFGDEAVRALASRISSHPEWASWLVTDSLLIRLVTAVESVADGYSPRSEFGFVGTNRPFLVREDEGRLVIAAGTYRRYDLAVDVFNSLDADAAVAIYRELEPAIHDARQDVAWHRGDFEDRLRQAIDHLLEVNVPAGAIEVERRTMTYAFASDEHERLSDAQRQLLRMGRENALAVQDKLREIRSAFSWPAAPAPTPAAVQLAQIVGDDAVASDPIVIAEATSHDAGSEEISLIPVVEPVTTPLEAPAWMVAAPNLAVMEEAVAPAE